MSQPLLKVRDLTIRHRSSNRLLFENVSFELEPAETLGILGASGTGKTTLARALLQLLPADVWRVSGSIQLNGIELSTAQERDLQRIRGARITMVSQEPELALNPVLPLGTQVQEVLRAHFPLSRRSRQEQAKAALAAVGLPDPRFYLASVQELSGGERQRVVIAQALAAKPAVLILDEPTSAVDTITQAEVLQLLKQLRETLRLALLFITHNPALLAGFTTRALLLREGSAQEVGISNESR
jgi:ABC-type glutathione transport system ATPase component